MTFKRWIVLGCVASAWCVAGCETDGVPSDDGGTEGDGGFEVDAGIEPEVDAAIDPEVDAGEDAAVAEEDAGLDAGNDAGMDSGVEVDDDAGEEEEEDAAVPQGELEITGRWHTNYGGVQVIDSDAFDSSAVADYDNADNVLYTQNAADYPYGPNKFNKIVWTEIDNGSFYYCFVDFSLDTLEDAKASIATADDTDPESGGCGGSFPWTKLSPVIEIEGRWHSSAGGTEVIDSDAFSFGGAASAVIDYDNAGNTMITQNPDDLSPSALKFNKVVWTQPETGGFYYCFVDSDLDTYAEAMASAMTADDTDPDTGGCADQPWIKLSPVIEVEGVWTDGIAPFSIDSDAWGSMSIVSYAANSAITQNEASAVSDPLLYNKVAWTGYDGDSFYFCFLSMGQQSAEDAEANAAVSMPADLDTGCDGGAWTQVDAN